MKKLLVALSLALVFIILTGQAALAFLTSPTSVSFVAGDTEVFRNLAESGDMLVVFHYKIAYTTYPTTSAADTVIFRMYDTDGTTLINQSRPYYFGLFTNYGYGDGVASFYFTAADAPPWGQAYFLNILMTPAYFSPAASVSYSLAAGDFNAATTQADSQYALYTYIMGLCDTFHDIYATVPLKAVTDTDSVLSVYGEPYFRAVIPGLQTLCPELFFVQESIPEAMAVVPYSMNSTMTTSLLVGTDLQRGATRIGVFFGGISGNAVFGGMYFIICIVICAVCYRRQWGVEPALAVCVLLGLGAASIVKDFFFTLAMIGGLIGGIAISYILLFRRA